MQIIHQRNHLGAPPQNKQHVAYFTVRHFRLLSLLSVVRVNSGSVLNLFHSKVPKLSGETV